MKASELIKKLNTFVKTFGDLEVTNEVGDIIKGVGAELNVAGEGTSHFYLDESFVYIEEFSSIVNGYMEDGMSEEEARKAAFEEIG